MAVDLACAAILVPVVFSVAASWKHKPSRPAPQTAEQASLTAKVQQEVEGQARWLREAWTSSPGLFVGAAAAVAAVLGLCAWVLVLLARTMAPPHGTADSSWPGRAGPPPSLGLGKFGDGHGLWLAAFVGVTLIQSAFTGFCPACNILRRLGVGRGQPGDDCGGPKCGQ